MIRDPFNMELSDYRSALSRMGLLLPGDEFKLTPLTGGVSSDILRVDVSRRTYCIKRALPQLKVAADWQAPIERNHLEVRWMRVAAELIPQAVPQIMGEDVQTGMYAMEFLPEDRFPVWKNLLRDGVISIQVAREVARRVATFHSQTARRADIASQFLADHIFHSIRLEPYLAATGRAHPDLSYRLNELLRVTSVTKLALVHGDVSPKNILIGPHGPVFLDAECAWYGDPAFDLAFCLNHFLLKCLWRPQWREDYLRCYDTFATEYLSGVTWEPQAVLEARAAHLLPGLLLARVDGKSPLEYLTEVAQKNVVREVARELLRRPVEQLVSVRSAWHAVLETRQ